MLGPCEWDSACLPVSVVGIDVGPHLQGSESV